MEYKLEELIDIRLIQNLQDKLNEIFSFPSSIVDTDGKILTATAWQDICWKFHRVNPLSESECRKSGRYIIDHLHEANPAVTYSCPHGMIDCAVPIIIDGKHLGTFLTGQFFLEKPDINSFIRHAKKYGFDEKAYLEAVSKVPVWPEERIHQNLSVIKTITEVLAEIGYKNLKEIEERKIIEENMVKLEQMELNLSKSENRFKQIVENSSDFIWEIDPSGLYTYCSDKILNILGYSTDEIVGQKYFYDFFPDNIREELKTSSFSIFERNESFRNFIHPKIHRNGQIVIIESSGSPFFNEEGILIGYRGADSDKTQRTKAENALKESEEKYKTTFKTIPDAIIITKMDGIIVDVNDGFSIQSGFTKEEAIGSTLLEMKIYTITEERNRLLDILRANGIVDKFETLIRLKDNSLKTVIISASIIDINNEQHILSITRDITYRKEVENELIKSKEKAEEASRLKTSLLLNISHELRTPLNGILGFAELLTETMTDAEQKEMVNIISVSGKRLMATLDSIMELAQVEADRTHVKYENIDIGQVTGEFLKRHKDLFEKKRIQYIYTIDKDVCSKLDKKLFNNILLHLIDNAMKFTENGSVHVTVKKEIKNAEHQAVVKVKDTGIGISEEQLGYVFEAFRQGDEGIGRSYEGTGLGLTLCKKFTTLMGGEIEVESKVGVGSTFTLRFPLSEEKSITEEEPSLEDEILDHEFGTEKPRVLIVEDNEANSNLMAIYLKNQFVTDQAYNGIHAVKMAYLNSYDVILMDINLGQGKNGIESAKEIRKIDRYSKIQIIAVTGYSTEEEKQLILSQGFDDFLIKPFDKKSLISIVKSALKKNA